MSARATRPRSRRGRHPPPGELDPVVESSEEAEATSGSFETKLKLLPEHLSPDLQRPGSRPEDCYCVGSHGALALKPEEGCKAEVESPQSPWAAIPDSGPAEASVASVFQTLQSRLSSLEATVAAWRHHSLGFARPAEGEDSGQGAPGSFGGQEEAGSGQQEAARLIERNAWLRLALGSREEELVCAQASLQAARAEKETLQKQVRELEDSLMQLEASLPTPLLRAGCTNSSNSSSSGAEGQLWAPQDSPLAHPLLQRLRSDSSTHIFGCLSTQPSAPETHLMEDQMGQLQGSIEKLKCFNRLLLAVLQGHKGRCESLSMQLGQREAEATALRLALQYSPEGSSVDKPTPQELAAQLHDYIQHLRERWALVKIPPALSSDATPRPTMPHAEATVQAILEIQPGPALPRLEKSQIQQDLVATRDSLGELMLRLQLSRREKRGLELRESALRAQGPAHLLLLQQLRWERTHLAGDGSRGGSSEDPSSEEEDEEEDGQQHYQGPPALPGGQMGRAWDSETLSQELSASLARTVGLRAQLLSLRQQLEQVAQKGRTRRAQSAELNRELCKAHSSLVLAFRGAHQKQEEQRRKLEQQIARMQAQQVEELTVLTATARALEKPGTPQPGQTFL
ncbi:Usher syndrome type-1C protein-binding protein 1 isoform X2 [Arvicola amphibius]|uniref:Usher syndrome type-1C protein-binding protein 1 isoform X2 n=1 Tax=Arvicola amphibius TaxID=1047088 RepID=UPI0018E38A11|nr:Usher syndrome type-1C protein-binding protein 1 isoform X2 [Arvicola amphibius]